MRASTKDTAAIDELVGTVLRTFSHNATLTHVDGRRLMPWRTSTRNRRVSTHQFIGDNMTAL